MISETGSVEAMLRSPGFPSFGPSMYHSRVSLENEKKKKKNYIYFEVFLFLGGGKSAVTAAQKDNIR